MAYLKNEFETWIKSAKRNNGSSYSTETINNYISVIKNYCKKLDKLSVDNTDLFYIDNATYFEKIHSEILNHPDFDKVNQAYHRAFSSGLLIYKRFLQSRELPSIRIVSFEEWLTNYKEHKYRDSTIKRYIVALQKAEERLSIALEKPVLKIKSLSEFESAVSKIQAASNYDYVNKKYGNGDLSAALSAYAKYLKDVDSVDNSWWPSQEEYHLNLTKDDWKKYLFEIELPSHPSPIKMLKGMIELGNEASCKQLSDTYGGHPSVYAGCAMNLGRRVKKYFNLPACMDGDQERYFPFPFVGKYRGGSEDNYIYKIRPELSDALKEIDLSNISPYYEEEHKLGTFDSWEIIDENTAIKTCDKSFFEHKGSGVPKNICWFFDAEDVSSGESNEIELLFDGNTYIGKLRNDTTDRRRIQIFWNTDLANCLEKHRIPNATATFKKIDKNKYEIMMNKEGEKEMTIKDQITAIKTYIATKGFNYDGALIENFYLGLKSKPFVILAGTSGTGKTRLVRLFAEAIGAEYKLVSVRPDWSDSSDLFGHVDLNQKFVEGSVIKFVKQAELNPSKPYFLCLDEMNLARVEYYMSDILSAIETRRHESGMIVTDPIDVNYGNDSAAAGRYGKLILPGNLYIVGTVNMDETTFPFSKKVLDRANTIEFSYVDLLSLPSFSTETAPKVTVDNDFLASKYITLNDCDAADKGYISGICTTLSRVNGILEMANAHIGYRVRDEIVFYMLNNKKADLLDEKVAFDNQIMQKILPRVQGSSESIKKMLEELLKICDSEKFETSAKKINFMIKRYDEDGFTSYWL